MKEYIELPLEIDAKRLLQFPAGSYLAADMRDEYSCGYGMLDGAVRVGEDELRAFLENGEPLPALVQAMEEGIPIVLYCKYGRISFDAAEALREKGYGNFCSLQGGYGAWALEASRRAAADEERRNEIEKALRKTFRHDLIGRFEKAVVQYNLVEEGDRIAICISGGKDSMLMAKLFQELKRHNSFPLNSFLSVWTRGTALKTAALSRITQDFWGSRSSSLRRKYLKRYMASKSRPAICARA